jgi:hypothetical protein
VLRDFANDIHRLRHVESIAGNAHRGKNHRDMPFGKLEIHRRAT